VCFINSVKRTPEFDKWIEGIRDNVTKIRLKRRLDKAERGNMGDVKPVGEGVYEMREFFGSGWRMYYIQQGDVIIVMLGGGDKSTQQDDIAKAISLSKLIED
jgi:putative addiction module killer protein